jgi:hypothetical protein
MVPGLVDILAAPPCAELSSAPSQLTLLTGSVAAALMAKLGFVPSGSVYAYLQSCAMGGYGTALVQGIVRAEAVASGASSFLASWWSRATPRGADDNARGEIPQEFGVEADMPLKFEAKL